MPEASRTRQARTRQARDRHNGLDFVSTLRFVGIHVVAPLTVGGLVYVLWRSSDLTLFRWSEALGLYHWVASTRSAAIDWEPFFGKGIFYCLPDGLWVYSATACFYVFGPGSTVRGRTTWSMLGVGMGLLHEAGQAIGFWGGTFDSFDILAYCVGFGLAYTASSRFMYGRLSLSDADHSVSSVRYYIQLSRPVMGLYVSALLSYGYGLAHWDYAINWRQPGNFFLLLLGWMVLHFGTLVWNACRDRDAGPIAMGTTQPIRRGTRKVALSALSIAAALGLALQNISGVLLVFCVCLALLYSWPTRPWKSHWLLGPVVNLMGYGLATPVAGYLISGVPLTPRAGLVIAGVSIGVLAIYFLTQSYQEEEDRSRGDRTLVARRGTTSVIRMGQHCLRAAGALFIATACLGYLPRVILLTLAPGFLLDREITSWAHQVKSHDMAQTDYIIRQCALVALVGLLLVLCHHLWTVSMGGYYAGYGTATGHALPLLEHLPEI